MGTKEGVFTLDRTESSWKGLECGQMTCDTIKMRRIIEAGKGYPSIDNLPNYYWPTLR